MKTTNLRSVKHVKRNTALYAKNVYPIQNSTRVKSLSDLKTVAFRLDKNDVQEFVINLLTMCKIGDPLVTVRRKPSANGKYMVTVTSSETTDDIEDKMVFSEDQMINIPLTNGKK